MRIIEEKYGDNGGYTPKTYEFDLKGAWRLRISAGNEFSCGGAMGFDIEIEMHPHFLRKKYKKRNLFYGGVLPTAEAKLLAKNILKQIDNERL